MYKLETLEFGGKKYPYIIDLNVLEAIQDEFGSIQEFERRVIGLLVERDEYGEIIHDEVGNPKMKVVEPSLKHINFALVEMINEGLAIESRRSGKEYEPIDALLIMAECDINYIVLANLIKAEFDRRFVSKKSSHQESHQMKRSN